MIKKIRENFFILLFICSSIAVLIVAVFAVRTMQNSSQMVTEATKDRLIALSKAASYLITAEDLEGFNEPEDMEKEEYVALKRRLIEFTEEAGLAYTYYIRYDPETDMQRFIIDNTPVDYTALSEPPLAREPATDLALAGVANAMELGSYSEGWEGYMTAFAPVYNDDGSISNVIAGVDMIDVYIRQEYDNFNYLSLVLTFSIMVIIAVGILSVIMYQIKARQSKAASNSKTAFLANMSHEMRTPMNAIIGMAEIARKSNDMGQVNDCLGKIDSAAMHLLGIINDVLDISKIEAGKLSLAETAFDTDKMIQFAVSVISFKVDEKNQHFAIEVADDVPRRIRADYQRFSQVISNLLSNAVKFTPDGGHIGLSVKRLGDTEAGCMLEVSVSDDGIGMSEEQQKKLFQAFEQADDSISRRFGGTGLGLSISKSIVDLMGGDISVKSRPGGGSVFTFTAVVGLPEDDGGPRHIGGEDEGATVSEAEESGDGGAESSLIFGGKRMLLAEDIEINQEIVVALLEDTGIVIDIAQNGLQAYEMFLRNPEKYDIVFMDIHMPDMDGYAATMKIRESGVKNSKTIPIIAMTANVFKEDIERCLAAGMNDHLGKPIDFDDMMAKLSRYLLAR